MELHHLNSLRLGFSTKQAASIQSKGIANYISYQLNAKISLEEPKCIQESPKSLQELQELKKNADKGGKEVITIAKQLQNIGLQWKAFLIQRCYESEFPLREKINLFFQNHFVSTFQSVKVPFWIYKHYETIHENALGNYKTIVKEMVYTNAMIKYLDNQKNTKNKVNENLARELLELFTLGEGNYTENDIKNTALALAGLTFGENKGAYKPFLKDNSTKTVFGKSGNFTIDDVIDVIFEQKNTAYFLAEKVLKWFFYDNPSQESIVQYGNLLKKHDFELKPFFQDLFEQECSTTQAGNQIKNPLVYILQIHNDLQLKPHYPFLAFFLKNQGMDLYDQANVKGWKGGQHWLTAQMYTERNQWIDYIISGNKKYEKIINRKLERFDMEPIHFSPKITIQNQSIAKTILNELCENTIFQADENMQTALNGILVYDFNPKSENAQKNILNVYQFLAKSPEFQIL